MSSLEESPVVIVTSTGREFRPLNERWHQHQITFEGEIERLRGEAEETGTANARKIEGLRAEVAEITERELAATQDMVQASRRERDAKEEIQLLRTIALPRLENKLADLEKRLQESENARAEAEAALEEIQHSSSWRLTAPLRLLLDSLRGRRSDPRSIPATEKTTARTSL